MGANNIWQLWSGGKPELILTTKVATNLSVSSGRNILSQRGRNMRQNLAELDLGAQLRLKYEAGLRLQHESKLREILLDNMWQILEQSLARVGNKLSVDKRRLSKDRDCKALQIREKERAGQGYKLSIKAARLKLKSKSKQAQAGNVRRATH